MAAAPPRRAAGRLLALGALALALAAPPPAPGAADEALDAAFFRDAAYRAYVDGRYAEALDHFLEAQQVSRDPDLIFNAARAASRARQPALAFVSFQRFLEVTAPRGEPADLRAAAQESLDELRRRLALVEVSSDPPGAAIVVDTAEGTRGVTPRVIPVAPGAHRVVLRLPGYQDGEVAVEAVRGRTVQASATLIPRAGRVRIAAVGGRATLRLLQGTDVVAEADDLLDAPVPVGRFTVQAVRGDAVVSQRLVVIREGTTERLQLSVPPEQRFGRILVMATPLEGEVYLDGQRRGVVPFTLNRVPAGPHVVEVRAGDRTASREVTLEANDAILVRLELQ